MTAKRLNLFLLLFLAFASAFAAPRAAPAQTGLVLQPTNESYAYGVSVRKLGLVPMHETGGTTTEVATANTAALNAYFAGGWRTHGLTLYFPAGGWAINDTIVIPRIEGLVVLGAGVGDTRAEVEYTAYGGSCARIVNIASALDVMIDYAGLGITWDGVQVQGWWHATNGGTLKAATTDHARVGILQRCGDGVVGSGKFSSDHLVVCCCENAIQWGDSALGDNADQWEIGRLYTPDCRVGIHSICRQAIGSTVIHYDGVRCELLHDFELGGGDYTCVNAILQNGSTTLLETRAQVFDDGCYYFGRVKVDGTCGADDVWLWKNNAPEGSETTSAQFVTFGTLHQAVDATGAIKVELNGYCRFHVDRGEQIGNLQIVCKGGNASFMNEIDLQKMRTRNKPSPAPANTPYDPAEYITLEGTTAYARVKLADNVSVGNVRLAPDEYKLSRASSATSRVDY